MSDHSIHCPGCKSKFLVSVAYIGRKVKCQSCQTAFVVPPALPPTPEKEPEPEPSGQFDFPASGRMHTRLERKPERPALRVISLVLKCVGLLQVLISFGLIVYGLHAGLVQNVREPWPIFLILGAAYSLFIGVIILGMAEVLQIFMSQERFLCSILNELRIRV